MRQKSNIKIQISKLVAGISLATVLLTTALPAFAQTPVSGGKAVNVNLRQVASQIPSNFVELPGIIGRIFTVTITAAGGLFVIMLLFGGINYLTGAGNEESTKKAKGRIIDASIGIVITLSAFAIGTFILNQFYKGSRPPSQPATTQQTGAGTSQAISFSVRVQDQTGNPVNGATVSVNGNLKGRTNSGKVSFQVTQGPGSYTVAVSSAGCDSHSEQILMTDQGFVEITLNCVD
ncbi:MAG: hypothetical protein WAP74_02545 [Patescibacteria group bacterium]